MSVFNLPFKVSSSSRLAEQGHHADCFRRFSRNGNTRVQLYNGGEDRGKTIGRHASTRDFHLLSFLLLPLFSFGVITKPRVPPTDTFILLLSCILASITSDDPAILEITIDVAQSSSSRSQITIIRVEVEKFYFNIC